MEVTPGCNGISWQHDQWNQSKPTGGDAQIWTPGAIIATQFLLTPVLSQSSQCRAASILEKSIFIDLKCKGVIWGSLHRQLKEQFFILQHFPLFTMRSPNGHYSPPILDHSECNKPPHVVSIKLHIHLSLPESLISSSAGWCFYSSLFFLLILKDSSHSCVNREEWTHVRRKAKRC